MSILVLDEIATRLYLSEARASKSINLSYFPINYGNASSRMINQRGRPVALKITMRGNAARYTCKSNRVYLCNRSRGTIESIAVFKVILRGDMSFIREEIPARSSPMGPSTGKKLEILIDFYPSRRAKRFRGEHAAQYSPTKKKRKKKNEEQ